MTVICNYTMATHIRTKALHATDAHSLDVTQQGHSPQYPVAGVAGQCRCRWSLEHYCCDVGEVSAAGLLVHRALVQLAVVGVLGGVHCVEVDHWEGREEDLGLLLH